MKVSELIKKLKEQDQDDKVFIPTVQDGENGFKECSKAEYVELGTLDNDSIDIPCVIIE